MEEVVFVRATSFFAQEHDLVLTTLSGADLRVTPATQTGVMKVVSYRCKQVLASSEVQIFSRRELRACEISGLIEVRGRDLSSVQIVLFDSARSEQ